MTYAKSYRAYLRQSDLPTQLTPVCRSVSVPLELIPIINAHLAWLTQNWMWTGSQQQLDGAITAINTLIEQLTDHECGDPECECCIEYFPDHPSIEWQPEEPYTLSSPLDFEGGIKPWYFGKNLPGGLDLLPGKQDSDVFTFGTGWDISRILTLDFPRFKIRFSGSSKVQLNLIKSPVGGQALVTVDGDPLTAQFVDLMSLDLDDVQSYLQVLATLGKAVTGALYPTHIVEIDVRGDGEHYIDVTMLPNITFLAGIPSLTFSGGLRKIVICGYAVQCPDCPECPDCPDDDGSCCDDCGCCDDDDCGCCDDDCGCCDDDDCGCCKEKNMAKSGIKDIKLVGGKLIKILCDGTEEIVGDISGRDTPTDVPEPDGQVPTADNACYKANGVWNVISDFTEALIQVLGNNSSPLGAYQEFQSAYTGLDEDNWQLFSFLNDKWGDDVGSAWTTNKTAIRSAFICAIADKFDKTPRLSDVELSYVRLYDFDSQSGALDGFLTDVLKVPEAAYYKRVAAMYAETELGDCPCGGPLAPPDVDYDWCYTWDFTESVGGWSYRMDGIVPEGEYEAGVGHKAIENASYTRLTLMKDIGSVVTAIDVHYEGIALGNYQEDPGHSGLPNRNFNLYSGEVLFFTANIPSGSKTWRWQGNKDMGSLQVMLTVAYDAVDPVSRGGSATCTRITLYGRGTNPFGSDNCE